MSNRIKSLSSIKISINEISDSPLSLQKFQKAAKKIVEENKERHKYRSILQTLDRSEINKIILPVCIMNWLFGMGVIEYPLGQPWPLASFFYAIGSLLIFSVIVVVSYFQVFHPSDHYNYYSVPRRILFYSNIFLSVSFVLLGWCHRQGMYCCITKMTVADNLMKIIGITKSQQEMLKSLMKKIIVLIVVLLSMLTIILGLVVTMNVSFWNKALRICILYYPILTTFVADFTFMYCISSVSFKFGELNKLLRSLISTSDYPLHARIVHQFSLIRYNGKISEDQNPKINGTIIKMSRKIHAILITICEEAEKTFRLQMLISIVVALMTITGGLYDIYQQIGHFSHDHARRSVPESFAWIIYHMIKIYTLSWICSDCKYNANTIGDIINKLYDEPSISEEAQDEIRNFNVQLVRKPLTFTAYGLAVFDNTLIQMSISAIVTYLIILIDISSVANVHHKYN